MVTHESKPSTLPVDIDPVIAISRLFANTVTKECFESLVKLLSWSWSHFKVTLNAAKEKVIFSYKLIPNVYNVSHNF